MQDWCSGDFADAGDGSPLPMSAAGADVGEPGDVVARGLVEVQLLADLVGHLKERPVFGVELGEVPVHDPAGVEAVLVGVEGYHAAELHVHISISARHPLEPLPLGAGVILLPVRR